MQDYQKRCWATIELSHLEHNVAELRKKLSPHCKWMGVVKADAYGHGDKTIADRLARLGADWLGVSCLDEALSLRRMNIFHPILIFGVTPPGEAATLSEYSLTQTVHSPQYARELEAAAEAAGVMVQAHIKADTGMARLGFVLTGGHLARGTEEIAHSFALPHLQISGIYTHFAAADERTEDAVAYTREQLALFLRCCALLEAAGIKVPLRHCCGSAGILNYPEAHLDMVRPGILLYGLSPGSDCDDRMDYRPVMSLHARVAMVKEVEEGTPVSYGRTFRAPHRMRIATIPLGYADGYARNLSGNAQMLIRGKRADIVGRICMDQLMLDVTHIDDVTEGDLVTVVGIDAGQSVTIAELAERSGTIPHERTCAIGRRIPRLYQLHGKNIGGADYLYSSYRWKDFF